MTNIKVSASITLPGSVRPAEKPISKTGKKKEEKENINELYNIEVIHLDKGKPIVIRVRKPKPAKQSIHICQEGYDDMVARPLKGFSEHAWKRLSANKRVKLHLIELAQSLGGKLDSFEVMKD